MYLSDDEISERFREARPGLDLIAVEDAAIPVTVLEIQVLAQEDKGMPLLDEFILRSAKHGIVTVPEIAAFLGFNSDVLDASVASQLAAGNITYHPSKRQVTLTQRGIVAATDLTSLVPVEQEIPVVFDRTAWRIADYRDSELVSKRQSRESGMVILPAAKSSRIQPDDIRPKDVEDLVSPIRDKRRYQVLEVAQVRPRKHQYLPVKMLVFSDGKSTLPEIILVVDGEESHYHLNQLNEMGGVGKLGMKVAPLIADGVSKGVIEQSVRDATTSALTEGSSPSASIPQISQISVFEHPPHLKAALTNAKSKLLIISPWIRAAVVNTAFMADLERRLRAGTTVMIGHGYGHDDSGSDDSAIRRLQNLQSRFPANFTLVRLPNTHAKILIYDDIFINTSFNWLSFRGDLDRTYRMEEGVLVNSAEYANSSFAQYAATLNSHT